MPPGGKYGKAVWQWRRDLGKPRCGSVRKQLAAVAAGEQAAELVITDARLVNVCTGEILPHTGVAVAAGRIALVGDAAHCIGPDTEVVDAGGKYLAPGFMDGHMHLESAMVTAGSTPAPPCRTGRRPCSPTRMRSATSWALRACRPLWRTRRARR